MTFMPKFKQTATDFPHEYHANLEADLLGQRSRESLFNLLINLKLAASESIYKARLETELQVLEDHGFCGYFLIVADYVRWAKDNGIAVGPGRGSGPCSLVGFALGITNLDPIKYGLPFERFVNPDKGSLPDFDLDFCGERSGEVACYLQSRYGTDQIAQISSDDITPLPSRLVICDRPLAELVPLYSNPESGFPATKMTVNQIRDAGLVQFNVIKQKALTVIQRAVQNLTKSGTAIDIDNIPLNDKGAYRLLCGGEASNIAGLDGEHYKATLNKVMPKRFEELYAVVALCHPRSRGSISLYVECKRNPESIHYYHSALESITAETYGVLLYQEQLMHITHKIAGLSMSQGDMYRRAVRDSNRENLSTYKKIFVDGAIDFGLSRVEATGLFEHLRLSGRNAFNKSHAVAFAMIAYQSAWLKANYPSAFFGPATTSAS